MMEREKRGGSSEGRNATPERLASTNPPVSNFADYGLAILQTVMGMQDTLGQLKQAVATLTERQNDHTTKLEVIGKDVHSWKVTLRVIGVVIVGLGGLLGWVLTRAWDIILKSYIPSSHP